MKRIFLFFGVGVLMLGCKNNRSATSKVDNTATRYTAGLVTSTEKAKINVEKANLAIAQEAAAVDKAAQEIQ